VRRLDFDLAHVLVGKPVSTFPGHAPGDASRRINNDYATDEAAT
jgi:hypothetical protein